MSAEFVVATPYHSDTRSPARYVFSHVKRHWIYAFLFAKQDRANIEDETSVSSPKTTRR